MSPVKAGTDTTIAARCDGTKIEMTTAYKGLFIVREITPLRALALASDLLAYAQQMLRSEASDA
jgi:hypothetical protein